MGTFSDAGEPALAEGQDTVVLAGAGHRMAEVNVSRCAPHVQATTAQLAAGHRRGSVT